MKKLVLLMIVLTFISKGFADADAFSIEVPLTSATNQEISRTIPSALQELLIKRSGNREILQTPEGRQALASAQHYLRSYRIVTISNTPKVLNLHVDFEPSAIKTIVPIANSLPIAETASNPTLPVTLAWIQREKSDALEFFTQENASDLLEKSSHFAENLGMPLLLPLCDLEDLTALPNEKLKAFDVEALQQAGVRYQADRQLALRVIDQGNQQFLGEGLLLIGSDRFTFQVHAGSEIETLEQLFEAAADVGSIQTSEIPKPKAGIDLVQLKITGVNDINTYTRLLGYLEDLTEVKEVDTQAMDGHSVQFELQVRGGVAALTSHFANDQFLKPLAQNDSGHLIYQWSP